MRVLVAAFGSHGDVLPFLALARGFAARGHEVFFYANPFFRRNAEDAALRFVPISTVDAYETLFKQAVESDPKKAFSRVGQELAEVCPMYYEAMRTDAVAGDTISIAPSLLFAGRLLQETDGVPSATVHLAPSVFRSNANPPRLVPHWIGAETPKLVKQLAWRTLDLFYDRNFTLPLNRTRAALGLPPVQRIFRSWVHEADCVVGMFPEWFAQPQPDWPGDVVLPGFPLYDNGERAPLPQALARFLEAGPAPVAFSAGTATATADGFFRESIDACQRAGLRGVLLSHFPQQIPTTLPADVIHVLYAPFGAFLPRVAAFVHHGGIGSTSQALRAAVPQLIRPVAYDQFDNASRAVQLGVAKELLPKRYSGKAAASALKDITSDAALQHRCRQLATRLRECDAVAIACDAILARLGARLGSH